jgi:soluble lytic murein transglycosylase-like protein
VHASSASEFLAKVLLSAVLGAVGAAGPMSVFAEDTAPAPAEPQDFQAERGASPAAPPQSICEVLAAAAAANDMPAEFFTRLIWQESRFRPEAVSHARAHGVAQFMPGTGRMRGLADPFEPREAITKSAALLRDRPPLGPRGEGLGCPYSNSQKGSPAGAPNHPRRRVNRAAQALMPPFRLIN